MLSEIKEAGPGFEYFLKTFCKDWNAVQYHKAWKDGNLATHRTTSSHGYGLRLRC
ncbi:15538_t:CDS:2 [Funneliformis geosporum]|uniref:17791_t:CDS:1 n=1 Tax=Funneliformis geosporum TaxID=1117311 RepID=A0A9W4SSF0_9GLOM|nr:17791_t:CDS:2 [Funneliformis geosporum]CAI2180981.1 15538_t:CDS:2 [Funneliformis geosporum]